MLTVCTALFIWPSLACYFRNSARHMEKVWKGNHQERSTHWLDDIACDSDTENVQCRRMTDEPQGMWLDLAAFRRRIIFVLWV
jgi:hypothetical protein